MKKRIQGIIIGFLTATLLSGITVWAATGSQSISVTYRNIKLYVDGALITPKDVSGNIVEPFIYNGTTYLPVRAVGEALGKQVDWDGDTSSVYVGGMPNRPALEVPLYNKPYFEIGDSAGYLASGNITYNSIKIYTNKYNKLDNSQYSYINYVSYHINMAATKFKATLTSPQLYSGDNHPELVYKIYGDNKLLYTSPIMTPSVDSIPVAVDISGFMDLKIETDLATVGGYTYSGYQGLCIKGIENAVIVTTDY